MAREKKKTERNGKLKIISLGGLGEIGKNITVIECDNEIVVIDCGIAFPDEEMYGVDLIIPDVSYLIENKEKVKGFFNVKFIATLVATLTIPLLFYTYNGAIGKSPFYVDILIFYIASFVNSLISYKLLKTPKTNPKSGVYGLIGLLLLFLAFAIFTFYPPSLPIFIDPLNS